MAASPLGASMFKACALLTPFYRLFDEGLYKRLTTIKILEKIMPHYKIPCELPPYSAEKLAKWGHILRDPQFVLDVTPRMILAWVDEQKKCER